ncbi:P-type conjugative transfer protein TrbJ [Mesorhizobium sp. B4-1-4]|uniref:P-type conjugative transfer protein TrbJ n=1 Tax=Mesorhizobium sp. B4-1-4 TaxID=2589888 RepID=UPI00112CBEE2|nr:P-type conjugative transfer protein TrbJ [Mesorhizobium sp. B4-1-4]UCI32141.1 P-type conjugative transfer protein TrbJ [Mesorhizobium sp. B4-1-4]
MMRRRLLSSLIVSLIAMPMADYVRPANALIVFDPSNYTQNVLSAARALEQINNQIQSLQNQATMLQNMARNLQSLDFSSVGQLTGSFQRIDGLMDQASGLSFDLDKVQDQWRRQYPDSYDATIKVSDVASAARERWQSAMQAFRQTMGVQSQIVDNVRGDGELLTDLVNRSQGAAGALEASQATNQLIALSTKQQMQIQTLLATQFRAEVEDAARKAQSEEAARQTTKRFLGTGTAYPGN